MAKVTPRGNVSSTSGVAECFRGKNKETREKI